MMNILNVLTAIAAIDPVHAQQTADTDFNFGNILIGVALGAGLGIIIYKKVIGSNAQNKILNLKQQLADLHNEKEQSTMNATKLEIRLVEKTAEFKEHRNGLRDYEEKYIDLKEEFDDLKAKALNIQSENDDLKFEMVSYKKNYPILENTINDLEVEIQKLKE